MSNLEICVSPHLVNKINNIPHTMSMVIVALLPALFWGWYLFGVHAILLTLTCIFGSLSGEMFILYLRKRSLKTLKDNSALLTGILLTMVLPPNLPLYLALFGSWFAIIIGKGVFGGLGYNIFNPVLLGRAFLQISFPVAMTTWVFPKIATISAVTSATPLAVAKFEKSFSGLSDLFYGFHGGCIGETSAFLLLLGGIFLIVFKIIDYKIPLAIILSFFISTYILSIFFAIKTGSMFFHLFSGGIMIGAFFMATDPITSPITSKGKIIFGCSIGILVIIIRIFGGLPEGVMFSILFMNAFVPIINRHTKSAIFGSGKKVKL